MLADYNFAIYYKPGVKNAAEDTLSRLPIRDTNDLEAYSQLFCKDEVDGVVD